MAKINLFLSVFFFFFVSIKANPAGRIIGGRDAVRRQVPFMVSLTNWGLSDHIAGGALISDSWVLTCAQVLQHRAGNSLEIFLGIISLSDNSPSGSVSRRSTTVIPHPGFNPTTLLNNIGLVEIGGLFGFSYNDFIQPIFMESIRVDSPVTSMVSGWGSNTAGTVANSNILQVMSIQTMTVDECQSHHGTTRVDRDTICTRNTFNNGICSTDIGSPLVSNVQLIGIASWTAQCGGGQPDVFTRVSSYRAWIGSHVGF